jgi:hypothetical protein
VPYNPNSVVGRYNTKFVFRVNTPQRGVYMTNYASLEVATSGITGQKIITYVLIGSDAVVRQN